MELQLRRFSDDSDTLTNHSVQITRAFERFVSIPIQIFPQKEMAAKIGTLLAKTDADETILRSIATGRNLA